MPKDTAPPHKFGPGYDVGGGGRFDLDPSTTHSMPIRPHPKDSHIAQQLLHAASKPKYVEVKPDDVINLKGGEKFVVLPKDDDRPLIDKLHEATFHDGIGMQYIENKYDLRMLLRKAQRFTLDDATSAMVADFSIAVVRDLDTVRQMAIPPFPVTWIDINNVARLNRIKELGLRLTPTAAGETEAGAPVPRVGWLIWPANDLGGHYLLHCTEVHPQGMLVSPLAWWWHTDKNLPIPEGLKDPNEDEFIEQLTFGVRGAGVGANAFVIPSPLHKDYSRKKLFNFKGKYSHQIKDLMIEISGELRHVFGFLIALNTIKSQMTTQAAPSVKRSMPNGKPLLPLEHKVLHLHLRPKTTADAITIRTITKHKMREHDVRAHLRTLRNEDGSIRMVVKVPSHKRGDKLLGRIIRDETKVER